MSLPMTQILSPSNITCKLTGKFNLQENLFDILFPIFTIHHNEISLEGSGISGQYLYNVSQPAQSITLRGSGGGNLAGTPDVIYINMKGSLELKPNHENLEVKILNFTGLLQLTITGGSAILALVNPYGEFSHRVKKVFTSDNISLTNGPVSVTHVNCTRYITIGDISLTFKFV